MIPFQYNAYSSLLLVVIAPAMLYALLLLWRGYRQEVMSDKLVGSLVFLFALQATSWMLGFAGYYDQSGKTLFMFYFPWQHSFWYGPLVYLFFRSLTDRGFQLWQKPNWWHLLPGALFMFFDLAIIAADFLVIQVHTLDIKPNDLNEVPELWLNVMPEWTFTPLEVIEKISLLGYFIYTLILYRRYRKYLQTEFSNDELVHLRWLRNFLAFFLLLIVAIPVIEILAQSIEGMTYYEFNWYGFLLYALIAYYLGFQAYNNEPADYRKLAFGSSQLLMFSSANNIQKINQRPPEAVDHQSTPGDSGKDFQLLFQQIEATLKEQALYLEPTLTLQELADRVGFSSPEVSAAINREAKTNFNYYINAWRVEAVKEKLLDASLSHLSLLGIGLDAGFSSKATFNRAFKQHTGSTPRQFQKSQIPE